MFTFLKDRIIFNTVTAMIREGTPPNLVLLVNRLRDENQLDAAGGADYVAELTSSAGAFSSMIPYYGETLKKQAAERDAKNAIRLAAEDLKKGASPEPVIAALIEKLSTYGQEKTGGGFQFERIGAGKLTPHKWLINIFLKLIPYRVFMETQR
jgi:replicative DNA helicase